MSLFDNVEVTLHGGPHDGTVSLSASEVALSRTPMQSNLASICASWGAAHREDSPPPDKAVWGRHPDVLPDWRNVIFETEMFLALVGERPEPAHIPKNLLAGGTGSVHTDTQLAQGLEIPMAVSDARKEGAKLRRSGTSRVIPNR